MGTVLVLVALALGVVLWRRVQHRERERLLAIENEPDARVEKVRRGRAVAYLEPPALPSAEAPESPYRRDVDGSGDAQEERRVRARAALRNARWLLMGAVGEAEEAARLTRLGQIRRADVHTMNQVRSVSEALECVFEAEDCLGRRIVRAPNEPPNFRRFYAKAPELLQTVTRFTDEAFPDPDQR